MKKLYLLLLSAFFVSGIFAQHENAFIKEGKMWNIVYYEGFGELNELFEMAYVMMGDTLVNGKEYKKLYQIGDTTLTKPLEKNHCLMGCFREENQKVWFMPMNYTGGGIGDFFLEESLMYDFSANVGDQVELGLILINPQLPNVYDLFFIQSNYTVVIKEMWADEGGRRHIVVSEDNTEWIEGIGTKAGLFWEFINGVTDGGWRMGKLRCVKENEKIIYLNPDCTSCFVGDPIEIDVVVGLESPATFQPKVTLSPNPVRNDLNITVSEDMLPCVMNVFTPTGEYVTGKKLTKAQDQLSMMGMNAGLYLYRVTTDSGELLDSGKVIRE